MIHGWNSRDKACALVLTSQKEQGFGNSSSTPPTVADFMHFPSKLHPSHTWHMVHVLRWKQLSEFSKPLRMYCFHWNSWLLSQQDIPEMKSSIHHFGKKTRWDTFSSWVLFWSCQWGSYQLCFSMALPGNMIFNVFGLCPWPVWSLSSLHVPWVPTDVCSGCGSCSYLRRGLAFLSMTNTIFPAIFWSSCLCTVLPCCSPLLPGSDHDFWPWCSDAASRECVQS